LLRFARNDNNQSTRHCEEASATEAISILKVLK